jgi:hypothetical protein
MKGTDGLYSNMSKGYIQRPKDEFILYSLTKAKEIKWTKLRLSGHAVQHTGKIRYKHIILWMKYVEKVPRRPSHVC